MSTSVNSHLCSSRGTRAPRLRAARPNASRLDHGRICFDALQRGGVGREQPLRDMHHQLHAARAEHAASKRRHGDGGRSARGRERHYGLSMSLAVGGQSAADALGDRSGWGADAWGMLRSIMTAVRWEERRETLNVTAVGGGERVSAMRV